IMLHILHLCDDVVLTNHPTYFYFQRPNSITTSSFSERKMDWFYNCKENLCFIEEHHPDLRQAAVHRLASSLILLLQNMLLQPSRFRPQISELKLYLKTHYRDLINCQYNVPAEKKWLRILAVTSALHLDWLFRLSFCMIHPNIDRG
ncbi:MAG: hypothetical protein II290_05855, partial [Oscillospiraceae bacterium]|nr:hypothetical protein [Oscillospiraceae bacterium]